MRSVYLAAAMLAALLLFAGCQTAYESGVHYGYTGSRPAECTSCK